jgi:threonyl-tRNA synthetase
VLRLFPDAQPTIGPPIENGFYYDFGNLHIAEEDLGRIEKEMQKVAKENLSSQREEFRDKEEALAAFSHNPFKEELISELPDDVEMSAYRQGEFFDLCRGPHLPSTGKVKALKVMKTSGAYWRGDAKNQQLTRIYGITYPDRAQLKEYLQKLEEAKKRDHKVIGPRLGLFSLHEDAPGMPFIHPHGMTVWNHLVEYKRELMERAGFVEIKTPVLMGQRLWEQSGHWDHYRENMFTTETEEREYAIKPMNCPGCILYYKSDLHSYREFPLRIGEIGNVHRYEPHGALSGLFRVRSFHQDDAHVFMLRNQIQDEIKHILEMADELYATFGIEYHLELSTRPEEGSIGTDEDWEISTTALRRALENSERTFVVNEGDGAFYGPKIDFHLKDALGRTWQCGTIQLDMSLPERFDLEYTDHDGVRRRPIMLHIAIYGSLERFFGSLIEYYSGRFPLWLSPRQIRILTVADRHLPFAEELAKKLSDFRVELDGSQESVGKKVRQAQLDQVNYMFTVGDREMEHKTATLRTRNNVVHGELDIEEFLAKIGEERRAKSLVSPYESD